MNLDELRKRFPHLGFAVYAYDPDGPVTLEVHGAKINQVSAPTEAEAIALAFPSPEPETPEPQPADDADSAFG